MTQVVEEAGGQVGAVQVGVERQMMAVGTDQRVAGLRQPVAPARAEPLAGIGIHQTHVVAVGGQAVDGCRGLVVAHLADVLSSAAGDEDPDDDWSPVYRPRRER